MRFAVRVCSFLSFAVLAAAQAVSTSQIKGTVQDATGLAVPGAAIKATQADTGAVRTAISGSDGGYVLPSLPVGPYSLEVSKEGFAKYVQNGITLQVASNPTVDVVLKIGSVSEQVQVEANAAMVETQSTGVGQVIDSRRVLDLPLVGRQVTDLVVLSGAAVNTGTTTTNNRGVYPGISSFSVAGGLSGGNMYTLDGSFHSDVYANAALPLPFPDALQEFKVETSSLPAQYGYHSGGAINAVTKSGTNQFHGSLFEFLRNYDLNARSFFANARDGLKRNQWGGTFGGPIARNKLFFFAGFQGTNTRQTPSDTLAYVPTQAMLTGDFTAITSPACNGGRQIQLKAPFVNNRISPALLSTPAISVMQHLPPATNECGQVSYGIPTSSNEYFGVAKVDYQWNPAHSLFVRYLGTQFDQANPYTVSGNVLSTTTPGASDRLQSVTFGDTYLFGASVINSFRATYNRTSNQKVASQFFSAADVGINIYQYLPKYTSLAITGGFSTGGTTGGRATYNTVVAQLGDDVAVSKGRHQMAFGANLLGWQSISNANTYTPGLFTITGSVTGLGLADFMIGQIASLTQGAPNKTYPEQFYLGLYAQDSWKVKPGLTVSYGLRWEPYFPPQFGQNIMSHFDMASFLNGTKSQVFTNAPAGTFYPGDPLFGPNGSSGREKHWTNFAPRAGIVWDPTGSGKTVIRAGYGVFYDQNTVELYIATGQGPPWGGKINPISPPGGLADPYAGLPGGNPFPFVLSKDTAFPQYGTFDSFDRNTRVPYVQQWNLGIERQVGKNWLVSASYIGNEVVHLYGEKELNPAVFLGTQACVLNGVSYPVCSTTANTNQRRLLTLMNPAEGSKYGFIDVWDDGGTRSYNGLLLKTEKRLSRGFTITANYTWSHCIGNPVNTFPQGGNGGSGLYISPSRLGDRGDCTSSGSSAAGGTDHRHIANMTGIGMMPRFSDRYLRMLASGWQGSATVSMYSGDALTVVTGVDNALSGINSTTQYANQVLGNVYGNKSFGNLIGAGATSLWLNSAAFAQPAAGTLGNMAPGTVRGPGALIFNAGLSRLFPIRERQRLELRGEAQNVLNRTNFADPSVTMNSNTFGRVQSSGPARILQFALKYVF
jgi:carboxypeptidase family protein